MAASIDVLFTGLMLICIDGQPNCPQGEYVDRYPAKYQNTAWVVKADGEAKGPKRICGWYCGEETTLELTFKEAEFPTWRWRECKKNDKGVVVCPIVSRDVCISQNGKYEGYPEPSLGSLLRSDEIDRRSVGPDKTFLKNEDYVPTRIQFPKGQITGGRLWSVEGKPVRWYRTDGEMDEALPRALSDQLVVTYIKATRLTVTNCEDTTPLIELVLGDKIEHGEVFFRNAAKYSPVPHYEVEEEGGYDSLAYLLWYYRLWEWDTDTGKCPDYAKAKKGPVLLRCPSKKDPGCAYNGYPADTRFWPPILGPRKE